MPCTATIATSTTLPDNAEFPSPQSISQAEMQSETFCQNNPQDLPIFPGVDPSIFSHSNFSNIFKAQKEKTE